MSTEQAESIRHTILDTAIKLAETSSWEALHLHAVASEMKINLADIQHFYSQKDDLVEAWYDRADQAMLACTQSADFAELSVRERLHRLIMCWLDTLAQHKKISRDMLAYKLEPGHVHLQLAGILRISRTVQWLREAAQQDSTHIQRIAEEMGLTAIYLSTFTGWMFDESEGQKYTRNYLERKLRQAEKWQCLFTGKQCDSQRSKQSAQEEQIA